MSITPDTRFLHVTWDDPLAGALAARSMSGLDYLRAILAGRFAAPPISRLLDFRLAEVEDGRAVFTVQPGERHYNPIGLVHGGLLATVLDSAMGCAVHSTLSPGTGYTTLEIKVNFTRPVRNDTGLLRCEAEVVHRGRQTATAQGRVLDQEGRMYAHGSTTCLLMSGAAPSA